MKYDIVALKNHQLVTYCFYVPKSAETSFESSDIYDIHKYKPNIGKSRHSRKSGYYQRSNPSRKPETPGTLLYPSGVAYSGNEKPHFSGNGLLDW